MSGLWSYEFGVALCSRDGEEPQVYVHVKMSELDGTVLLDTLMTPDEALRMGTQLGVVVDQAGLILAQTSLRGLQP